MPLMKQPEQAPPRLLATFVAPFSCQAVQWSPFRPERLTVSTSQYFGIVGNGRQHVLDLVDGGRRLVEVAVFQTQHGLYDSAWNELNDLQLVGVSADGAVRMWDLGVGEALPVATWHEHTQETACVEWNLTSKATFATASWDRTLKLWDPSCPRSLCTYAEPASVYACSWAPHAASTVASCSEDGGVRIYDTSMRGAAQWISAHQAHVLSVDWDKYSQHRLVSSSADRSVRVWDVRMPSAPLLILAGHDYAVKKVACSPHRGGVLASASYDMTWAQWRCSTLPSSPSLSSPPQAASAAAKAAAAAGAGEGPNASCGVVETQCTHHTEFVSGIDYSLFSPGVVASCSWDKSLCIWA